MTTQDPTIQATPGAPTSPDTTPAPAPPEAPSTTGQDPAGAGPTDPTAAPGPVIAPASATPSDAPLPGTGPTDTAPAPDAAPAAETDPFDGAELVEVSERGFTFRQTFPDGGVGLITLAATLADQGGGTFGLSLAHPNAATD